MTYKLFPSVSLVSISISTALVIALHVLVPEYNPIMRAMSNYSNSRYGWMMVAAFLGFAVSQFALVAAFRQGVLSQLQEIGIWLLIVSTLCVLVVGIFPTDQTPDDKFTTTIGAIHAIAGYLLSPFIVGAMLCLSGQLDHAHRAAFVLAIITAIAFVVLLVVNALNLQLGGIGQRIFIALVCAWLGVTSLRFVSFQ